MGDAEEGAAEAACLSEAIIRSRRSQACSEIVMFQHSRSPGSKTALSCMRDYAGGGVLHVDGYAGCDALPDPCRVREPWDLAYCWTRWWRRFVEFQRATDSPICEQVIKCIAALYRVETMVRGKPPERRLEPRRELSAPIVEALHPLARCALRAPVQRLRSGETHPLRPQAVERPDALPR